MNTITAADFTIMVELPEIIWRKWNRRNIKESKSFKEYFQEKMQKQINKLPRVFSDSQAPDIACVYFAYNNSSLIKAL
jgi:hypothetical protein